ncbi:MAG: LexA family transcriptional regulator [Candidatus Nitrospinota bacterium M3_3B_026]
MKRAALDGTGRAGRLSFRQRMEYIAMMAGNATALSKKSGVSRRAVGLYLSGKSDPTRKRLVAMAKAAGVTVEWLATGEGPIQRGGRPRETAEDFLYVPFFDAGTLWDGTSLPRRSGGGASFPLDDEWIKNRLRDNSHSLVMITVSGDCMEPTINSGDILLLDIGQRDIVFDAIYALREGRAVVARRVQRMYDGRVKVKCDNTAYEDQVIPKNGTGAVDILGRVVWSGKKL